MPMRLSCTRSSSSSAASISLLVFLSIFNTHIYALSPAYSSPPLPSLYLSSFSSMLFVLFLSFFHRHYTSRLHPPDNDTKFNFSPSCLLNGCVGGGVWRAEVPVVRVTSLGCSHIRSSHHSLKMRSIGPYSAAGHQCAITANSLHIVKGVQW